MLVKYIDEHQISGRALAGYGVPERFFETRSEYYRTGNIIQS
jgi:hypothetical protein